MISVTSDVKLLISNNYDSVKVLNEMKFSIKEQNNLIMNIIKNYNVADIEKFYNERINFEKAYSFEILNITEIGEKELVNLLNKNYKNFLKSFEDIKNNDNSLENQKFYGENINPIYYELINNLDDLINLNEKAMFNSKNELVMKGKYLTILIFVISIIFIIFSILVSYYLINRFLKPLYLLINEIKEIKSMSKREHLSIKSNDELEILIKEFNKMTDRIKNFEINAMDQLGNEKNKSSALINNIPDPILVLNDELKIIISNNEFDYFFNKKKEDIKYKYIFDVIKSIDLYDILSNFVRGTNEKMNKILKINIDNKEYYFNVLSTKVRDINSNINGIIVSLRNITIQKEFEKMRLSFVSEIIINANTNFKNIWDDILELEKELEKTTKFEKLKLKFKNLFDLNFNLINIKKIDDFDMFYIYKIQDLNGLILKCYDLFKEKAENENKILKLNLTNIQKIYIDPLKIEWVINDIIFNSLNLMSKEEIIEISTFNSKKDEVCLELKISGKEFENISLDNIIDNQQIDCFYSEKLFENKIGLNISKEILESHKARYIFEKNDNYIKIKIYFNNFENR
jgi:signal transduction histidine kinase